MCIRDRVNVLNDPATRWWSDWQNGAIRGFGAGEAFPDSAFGTGAGQRLAGTEALALVSGGNRTALVTGHNPGGTEFTVSNAAHGFTPGDILIACGPNSEVTGVLTVSYTHLDVYKRQLPYRPAFPPHSPTTMCATCR